MATAATKVTEFVFEWEGKDRNGKQVRGETRAAGENQVMSPFVSTASCRGPSHVKCLLNVRAAPRNHTASSATNHRALALQPGLLRLNLGLQPHHDHCAALPCYGT